jgi:hypothetical protein
MNSLITSGLILLFIVSPAGIGPLLVFCYADSDTDTQKMLDRDCTPLLSDWNDTFSSWNCPYSSELNKSLFLK